MKRGSSLERVIFVSKIEVATQSHIGDIKKEKADQLLLFRRVKRSARVLICF